MPGAGTSVHSKGLAVKRRGEEVADAERRSGNDHASETVPHIGYYGVSGNMPSLKRYYRVAIRLALKWLNRRSQCRSFNWDGFNKYLKHYPLPAPRIYHDLYTLSPVK